ncbi:MAG: class I SAM-dependent methyltransferase [Candidatus Binatia bacterium]
MANFAPMRDRLLYVLRMNLELFGIRGRFLDYGAGPGDVARFLVGECGLPAGYAYDPALHDDEVGRQATPPGSGELTGTRTLDAVEGPIDVGILFDVLEHVPDAAATLRELHAHVRDDGWLAMTVPYNAHEWGVDDEFYGHLRRLSRRGAITLLEQNGWSVIRVLDPTFPTMWAIRRAYLLLRHFGGGSLGLAPSDASEAASDIERSFRSPRHTPWSPTGRTPVALAESLVPWTVVRRLDLYFESLFWGFELFVLAQKRTQSDVCEVCEHGRWTFHRFFDRYSLQSCGYCGSEKILPELATHAVARAEEKQLVGELGGLQSWLRRRRAARIRRLAAPERTLLDIGCGCGELVRALARDGWTTQGTASSEADAALARANGIDVVVGDVDELPDELAAGVVTMFHVVEHTPNLSRTLAKLDRLVRPGGYLVLEYPNGRSLLKKALGWRWFGYDPPYHRLQVNPVVLADRLGLANYRLLREEHFSLEYSFFVFAQSIVNALLPFQRDALYRLLRGRSTDSAERVWALASVPLFALLLPLFVLWQPLASLLRRGCVVRQTFKKTDIAVEPAPDGAGAAEVPDPQSR